jgi:hypothetical protein
MSTRKSGTFRQVNASNAGSTRSGVPHRTRCRSWWCHCGSASWTPVTRRVSLANLRAVVYRALVPVILVAHFTFLAYVVLGGFLAWRWPRAIWPHLAAIVWAVLIVANAVSCPLTWAENWARQHGGQSGYDRGFIDTYVTGVLYPARYLVQMRLLAALVVLVSWLGWWYRRRRQARRALRT